jgi:hypothetical protein
MIDASNYFETLKGENIKIIVLICISVKNHSRHIIDRR